MLRFARTALVLSVMTLVPALVPVKSALAQAYQTCVLHTSGRMKQFYIGILPDAKAVLLNKTFVYQRYENINPWFLQKEPLKLGPPTRVTFRETRVEIEQGRERFTQDITWEDGAWCEVDQLSKRRECYRVLADDPALPPVDRGIRSDEGPVVAFTGKVLRPDFCRAAVTGHFVRAGAAAAPTSESGGANPGAERAPATRDPAQGERRARK